MLVLALLRRKNLLPKLMPGHWTPGPLSQVVPSEFAFTYYAAVRNIELHAETEGLHMGVLPVLQLLARNDVGPTSATPFKDLLQRGANEAWLMLCSSSTTAMTVGYYAFKASTLQLLEVRAGGLLGSKAPWYHPMGSFWAISLPTFAEMLKKKEASYNVAPFEMVLSDIGKPMPQWKLTQGIHAEQLATKKRNIEEHILSAKTKLEESEKQKAWCEKELKRLRGLNVPEASGKLPEALNE